MITQKKVFISYSQRNARVVEVAERLLRAGGADVFRDRSHIAFGTNWLGTIEETIKQCDRVLLFWSAAAARSPWVRREIKLALKLDKTIVPVLLDAAALPRRLSHINGLPDLRRVLLLSEESEAKFFSMRALRAAHCMGTSDTRSQTTKRLFNYLRVRYVQRWYVLFAIVPILICMLGILVAWSWRTSGLVWVVSLTLGILAILAAVVAPLVVDAILYIKSGAYPLSPDGVAALKADIKYDHTGFVDTGFAGSEKQNKELSYKRLGSEFISTVFTYSGTNNPTQGANST